MVGPLRYSGLSSLAVLDGIGFNGVGDGCLFQCFHYVSQRLWLRFVLYILVPVAYITGLRK
jgi:hypothetical protein